MQSNTETRDDSCLSGCLITLSGPSARKASFLYAHRRAHNDTQKLDCQEEVLQVERESFPVCQMEDSLQVGWVQDYVQ